MMTLESAWELLADRVHPLPPVDLPLMRAVGCRLAEAGRADGDLPAADVSVMDGYAARASDLARGEPLPVSFEVPAGRVAQPLPRGTIARIFTGSLMPDGADTVVPQEQVEVRPDGSVRLAALEAGNFVRHRGELFTRGTEVASAGEPITPQLVALLASAGAASVRVIPRPRVALLSTGSELVAIEERPSGGSIRDTNGATLAALAGAAGFEVTWAGRAADDRRALRDAIGQAAAVADLIVTNGGVSVGDYDLVPRVLRDMGGEVVFHRVAIKPGKPTLVARVAGAWVTGLPGNPASALVGWRLFALPMARRLAGDPRAFDDSSEIAVATEPARNVEDRTILAPAVLQRATPQPRVTVLPWKGSHDVVTYARANALAVLEVGTTLAAGDSVRCYRLE